MTIKKSKRLTTSVRQAREQLGSKGWSQRAAAPQLGVCYQHLCLVLTGVRQSKSLLTRISNLPINPKK